MKVPSYSSVVVMGVLISDPTLSHTSSGKSVIDLVIAVNNEWKDASGAQKEEAVYVDIRSFGLLADALLRFAKKGDTLLFEGNLRMDRWENKTTGKKNSKLFVNASSYRYISSDYGRKPYPNAPFTYPDSPNVDNS